MITWLSELTKIFAGLKERFDLRERIDSPQVEVSNTIVPVTNVDELLRSIQIARPVNDVDPTATGWYTIDTVPQGKRRTYLSLDVRRSTGSTLTTSEFAVTRNGVVCRVETHSAAADRVYPLPQPITLYADDALQANVNAYGSGDKLTAVLYYFEEDAF